MFFISKKRFKEEVEKHVYEYKKADANQRQMAHLDEMIRDIGNDVHMLKAWKEEIMHNSEAR